MSDDVPKTVKSPNGGAWVVLPSGDLIQWSMPLRPGTRYATKEEVDAGRGVVEIQRFRALTEADYDRMNLPPSLRSAKLDQVPASVKDVVSRYIDNIDRWLSHATGFLIVGESRVGKTSLAAVLAKAAKARGRSAYFTRISELREAIKKDTMFAEDMTVMDRVRNVDFLVLDDLFPEDATLPYLNSASLVDLVLFRAERFHTTSITTSAQGALLQEKFGRLFNSAASYLVPLTVIGPDQGKAHDQLIRKELFGGKHGH